MSVVIRLNIRGRKHLAFHKVVVADSRSPRDGRHVDIIGFYDPMKNPAVINVDADRAKYWLERGATPSTHVRALFKQAGIELPKRDTKPRKKAEAKAKPAKRGIKVIARARRRRVTRLALVARAAHKEQVKANPPKSKKKAEDAAAE